MIAQCWLHIGTEKTGSTSIQNFLAQNRTALLARGWLYPETAGIRAHHSLVAYGLDDERHDDTRRSLGVRDRISLDAFRRQLIDSLKNEIAASGAATLVLSSERLATRLSRPTEIARLQALCDQLAQNTKIVVYIRNQADFLVSRYTNVIWEGGTGEFAFPARTAIADYKLLLDRWVEAFGKENVAVRRFEPADFHNSDLIDDLASAIGLDTKGLQRLPRANPSLDAESLAFLRGFNRRLPRALSARIQPFRGGIVRVLQRHRGGTKFVIPRGQAERIEAAYRESNKRVSADYFGSRFRPLFSPPLLVSETEDPPRDRIGALIAIHVAAFLMFGLLRDSLIWAVGRVTRQRANSSARASKS
jgi:hypothetical protein